MQQDLVSIIMPTYNAAKFLPSSIDSILNQTYSRLELLITDDGSTDADTLNILERYSERDERVKVVYLKTNSGAGCARNEAIKRAEGRYIAFCDSDDRWKPEKLETQLRFMREHQSPLVFSSYVICDENDEEKGIFIAPRKITYQGILRDNKIGCLTAMYDVEAIGEKVYMPSIRKRQDWAFFIKLLKQCQVAYGIQEPLAYYRVRQKSISRRKITLVRYNMRVYHDTLGFSWIKSWMYFIFLFMPSHMLKVVKRKLDSYFFLRHKGRTL